ncbi:TPR-like protein [Delitschia confertaspora ATCC 74209]|uniref:DNA-(apurinic or apyrimidinic site) lyase n=1 Tax=Delitschia confertaspora ATCC 74209 TaxID=1513339 RepID=A0A9P4MN27_9PLEO|nr:TPR-like protein [Delitschia confertaspora ATCC 74209]
MAQIAEVARIVHYLSKHIVGKTIAAVKTQEDDIVYGKVGTSASAFQKAMTGKKVMAAKQQGKYFWLEMESPPHPLMHFGMSGWMKFSNDPTSYYRTEKPGENEWPPKFWKFILRMEEDDNEVAFVDARRLARIRLVDVEADQMRKTTPLKENGPDPVIDSEILTVEWLTRKLRSKKVPIKALLLDQANISGVGNWVGDEVLYQARLHPEQYSNTFSDAQIKQLHDALMYVCNTAVDLLGDSEKLPENWLMHYRWGKGKSNGSKMPNGDKITFLKVGGRTSAVVPSIQKKTGAVAGDIAENADESEDVEEEINPKKGSKRKAKKEEGEEVDAKPTIASKRGRKKVEEPVKEEGVQEDSPAAKKQKVATNGNSRKEKNVPDAKEEIPDGRRRSGRLSNSKEGSLFRSLVKHYESKQYKKGLKAAEQILRKVPNHGETQAMKALILNSQGQTEEAFALARESLKNDMKSHVCWHVYGLLYRSQKNYEEAIKAYKFALRIEPDSQNILRDLALLQAQIRDYQGYIQSRTLMVQARPQLRQNWTALAVAHHLAGDYKSAEHTLVTYEETLKQPPQKTDLEHSEATLYKNTIIAESGDVERALEHLRKIKKTNLDRTAVMEMEAKYLLQLGKNEEAEQAYAALLGRNNEYRAYYEGLEKAKGLDRSNEASLGELKALYESYAEKSDRVDAARRIPLDFLKGDDFKAAADKYLRRMLNKGVPSTFPNIKTLYADPLKKQIIEELVLGYASDKQTNGSIEGETNGAVSDRFEQSVIYFLAQHYNYHLSRDLKKAMEYINRAIELNPKSVDYHQTKARIYKHYGNTKKASETIEYARQLDQKDRYINTKCAKYQLRNNENEAALKTMSKFTRNETVGGPLGDLHDMQCMWYLLEDGEAYLRQKELGLALKRFTAISDIFDIWQDDQFDFHSFSLRKGQIRAYVDMIRWEDHLRDHPFFARAAISAVKIYLQLADKPELGNPDHNKFENMDPTERKKAQRKARKEQERLEKEEAEKKAAANKKVGTGGDGEPKKEDPDPKGITLLQTKEPLEACLKFLTPMLEFSPKTMEAQNLGFEVHFRRKKYALALKCLLAARELDPENPTLHEQTIRFRKAVDAAKDLPSQVTEVLKSSFTWLPAGADLKSYNNEWQQKHLDSAPHLQSAYKVRAFLDPGTKEVNEKDIQKLLDLPSNTQEQALAGLSCLEEWGSDEKTREAYREAAAGRWPEATVFEKR